MTFVVYVILAVIAFGIAAINALASNLNQWKEVINCQRKQNFQTIQNKYVYRESYRESYREED